MSSSVPSTSFYPPPSEALAHPSEVHVFVSEDILQLSYTEQTPFLEILNVSPQNLLPLEIPKVANGQVTPDNFVKVANDLAQSMRDLHFADEDLLVFKSTGSQVHGGHVTANDYRPDYTAAFASDWGGKTTTLWPCIRLVGEKASQGKNHESQERQVMQYLHYLLLTRPELHVAQGLFISDSDIMFLLGIGGVGIHTFSVEWGSKELHRLIYAFIYRLYDPGHFADPSYVQVLNSKENIVTYDLKITKVNGMDTKSITISNLYAVYASNPFGTRTHILSNPNSEVKINDKPLTVIKDQLCRVGTQVYENGILTQVHSPETVPGVVEAVYHEVIKIPRDVCPSKEKHRLGLQQTGNPLTSVPTLMQMLEIVFDILEVLQYLRFERHVLHCDISEGNVLYVENDLLSSTGARSGRENETAEGQSPCFIKYLLGDSDDPKKTSVLLIDFNHAENLESKHIVGSERIAPIGTPVFMARAVQLGRAVPPHNNFMNIPEVPRSPGCYETCHPDRIKKFPYRPRELYFISTEGIDPQWKHELDHDTESVFWLLLYWVVGAQPENEQKEPISAGVWVGLTGLVTDRIRLLRSNLDGATHSFYQPLWPLLDDLAAILNVDRHWVESSNPRKDPGYINDAFQRLILQFILEHRNEPFMQHRVESQPRLPELISGFQSQSTNTSRKRPLSEPTIPGGTKRLCVTVEKMIEVDR